MVYDRRNLWSIVLAALALLLVAGCQTTRDASPPSDFTAGQLSVLRDHGFEQVDDHWELGLQGRLLFPFDTAELVADQHQRIDRMARALLEVGIDGARVEGHTDQVGSAQYNQELSLRRADAVKRAMISGGMDDENVSIVGKGSSQPIAENDSADGRRENRRVVVIVSPRNTLRY